MSTEMKDLVSKGNSLEEVIINEPPTTMRQRYKAEQERHLKRVVDQKADRNFNVRILFFPLVLAIVIALVFATMDTNPPETDSNGKRLSRRAKRRLAEQQQQQQEGAGSNN